jgi:enamine deaminase RidA (YjgF/YER057c/UK114 family)
VSARAPDFESGSPAARLAALGITLAKAAVPLAAYTSAERAGAYVYTSGQLPSVDGTLLTTGQGRAAVAVAEARACPLNALEAAPRGAGQRSGHTRDS